MYVSLDGPASSLIALADGGLTVQAHLKAFFKQAYETDLTSFRQLAETYLNDEEKAVLTHLLQSA